MNVKLTTSEKAGLDAIEGICKIERLNAGSNLKIVCDGDNSASIKISSALLYKMVDCMREADRNTNVYVSGTVLNPTLTVTNFASGSGESTLDKSIGGNGMGGGEPQGQNGIFGGIAPPYKPE